MAKEEKHLSGRSPRGGPARGLLLALAALALLACPDASPPDGAAEPAGSGSTGTASVAPDLPPRGPFSPDARTDVYASLRADQEAPRHAADGGGRAWLKAALRLARDGSTAPAPPDADGDPVFTAGSRGRFELVYEAGPEGVAAGGMVFLQVSPFWDWDDPQTAYEQGPGYTTVTTKAEGVQLDAFQADQQLLAIKIGGRALAPGDQLQIVYGAGPAGARVDRYAEHHTRLWFAVDGDGDGIRSVVPDSPTVAIQASDPALLVVTVPTTAAPGDPVRIKLAVVDGVGNAGFPWQGEVTLEPGPGLELPERVAFEPGDHGHETVPGRALRAGTYRLKAHIDAEHGPADFESNPLVVRPGIRRVLWGDLHGHSHLSDGTGTPDDYYDYARNVSALDVSALTDHDHWGMRFLDAHPELWDQIRRAAARWYEPGRFVTLVGYEWTSWLQGHRHVLYFGDDGDLLSSLDPRYQTPDELWAALRGRPVLTFAHHSAGGPVATNWSYAPPPDLEPLTEIVSVHGSSEAPDSPRPIYNAVPGNFVRNALALGYRFGFVGSGDSHDGHPGLTGLASGGSSGLAAIFADTATREAVLAALRARATYATNGPRIYLEVSLEPTDDEHTRRLHYSVAGTAPIERIDFIRSGLTASVPGDGRRDLEGDRRIPSLVPGEYLYLRVVQQDGGAAWSSPFYGRPPDAGDDGKRSGTASAPAAP